MFTVYINIKMFSLVNRSAEPEVAVLLLLLLLLLIFMLCDLHPGYCGKSVDKPKRTFTEF